MGRLREQLGRPATDHGTHTEVRAAGVYIWAWDQHTHIGSICSLISLQQIAIKRQKRFWDRVYFSFGANFATGLSALFSKFGVGQELGTGWGESTFVPPHLPTGITGKLILQFSHYLAIPKKTQGHRGRSG